MAGDSEFTKYIVELMQPMGPVVSKRMFGSAGIFLDSLMFGLISDKVLYLKADETTKHEFIDKGLEPFKYKKNGKDHKLSYYQAPEESIENADEMRYWANLAYSAAISAAEGKKK